VRRAVILHRGRFVSPPGPLALRVPVPSARSVLGVLATVALLFLGATFGVQLAYADRIPAGVHVLGVDLSGRTKTEARGLLEAAASSLLRKPVALRVEGQEWPSSPRDLGMTIDTDALLDQAYLVGREGNVLQRVMGPWTAILAEEDFAEPAFEVDADQAARALRVVAAAVDRPAQDARIDLVHSGDGISVNIVAEVEGAQLAMPESVQAVRSALSGPRIPPAIDLEMEPVAPGATTADFQDAKRRAERALSAPLTLTFADRTWTLDQEQIARMLTFARAPGEPAQVSVNIRAISDTLDRVSTEIGRAPIDARFDWNGGNLKVIRESREGRGVDPSAVATQIREHLFSNDRNIPLALTVTQPNVASGDADKLGIRELIREGKTSFAGSVPEKAHNISLAATRLNGTVIPPGEMFSFNKEVGPTTLAAGFQTGWGITLSKTGAQTIPSVAGGICQVATTLFHPVFHAGYQIEERHSHLYWIPSYGQPPLGMKGLDATVDEDYGLDFRFINTTPDYLLIQSRVEGSTLIFDLYGTIPTWDVQIDGPVVSNVVPTDRALVRQPEPTMPSGKSLQVEGAQDGFDVVVTRTVTQGDDSRTLQLKSHYIPSHNVVLYGAGPA